eukprot:scaffold163747_cov17-Prasinocladus_malaysianus.AAC.4
MIARPPALSTVDIGRCLASWHDVCMAMGPACMAKIVDTSVLSHEGCHEYRPVLPGGSLGAVKSLEQAQTKSGSYGQVEKGCDTYPSQQEDRFKEVLRNGCTKVHYPSANSK